MFRNKFIDIASAIEHHAHKNGLSVVRDFCGHGVGKNFHEEPNIFVVGDEKQAIYRFQGASLENFLYFEDLFPKAKRISLTENYRVASPGMATCSRFHDRLELEFPNLLRFSVNSFLSYPLLWMMSDYSCCASVSRQGIVVYGPPG